MTGIDLRDSRAPAARAVPTLAACTIAQPDRDLAEAAAALASEFGAIELTFDHGVSLPPRPGLLDDLAALRAARGLRYSVHLPLTIQLASPNPALRRASLDTLAEVVARCAPLDPAAWVLHVTPLFGVERSITGPERALAQQRRNVALAEESLAALLARTGLPGRRVAVENLNYPFEILDGLLERHDLGVCFDVGHLLARGGDPAAFVRRYAARLVHVHLHDVIDGLDHRPLGDPAGALDLAALWRALEEARYGGIVTLEVFNGTHIAQSLATVRPFLGDGAATALCVGAEAAADPVAPPDVEARGEAVAPTGSPAGAAGDAPAPPVLRPGGAPLRFSGLVKPAPRVHYLVHEFELAPGAVELTVTMRYHKERLCQLFLALFDPEEYRGTRMNPGGVGDIALELRLGEREAGPGALPGPLRPGRWRALIDIERTAETADYELEIVAGEMAPEHPPILGGERAVDASGAPQRRGAGGAAPGARAGIAASCTRIAGTATARRRSRRSSRRRAPTGSTSWRSPTTSPMPAGAISSRSAAATWRCCAGSS